MSDRIVVIGGGLAGLAAALQLLSTDNRVLLCEAGAEAGGRLASYQTSEFSFPIDNSQHLITGSCACGLQFFESLGTEKVLQRCPEITVLRPNGSQNSLAALSLPPPLHLFSYLRFWAPDWRSLWQAAWNTLRLCRSRKFEFKTVEAWLDATQPEPLIRAFWQPFVVSIFNEVPARVSFSLFRSWLREALLFHGQSVDYYLPRLPLAEIIELAEAKLTRLGGELRKNCKIDRIYPAEQRLETAAGEQLEADKIIAAVPPRNLAQMLPDSVRSEPPFSGLVEFETAPILALHLELDRPHNLAPLTFLKSSYFDWVVASPSVDSPVYLQFLKSAARSGVEAPPDELLKKAKQTLGRLEPEKEGDVSVESWKVLKNKRATVSLGPAAHAARFGPATPLEEFYVAGDWTATGWPATIESALRSGYRAASAADSRVEENLP